MASHVQVALKALIEEEFASMSSFASAASVGQPQVWRDCNGRKVSDERFSAYLSAVSETAKERLIRARLRDLLPAELDAWIRIVPPSERAAETPEADLQQLDRAPREALKKLARAISADPELGDWIVRLVRRIC